MTGYNIDSEVVYETARYCLMVTLACGFQALKYPACTKLLNMLNLTRDRLARGVTAISAGNHAITIGYNLVGFHDEDFSRNRYTERGPFIKLRIKAVRGEAHWGGGREGA